MGSIRMTILRAWSAWLALAVALGGMAPAQAALPADLAQRVAQQPRPRSWPVGAERSAIEAALLAGERQAGFAALLQRVRKGQAQPRPALPAATRYSDDAQRGAAELRLMLQMEPELQAVQETAFALMVQPDEGLWPVLRDQGRWLADLDPQGPTGVEAEDLTAAAVAWTLALLIDWHPGRWTLDERGRLVQAISRRMQDFEQRYFGGGPRDLRKLPRESHASEILGKLAETALLMAGDSADAPRWIARFVPAYVDTLSPWGGDDGGFANGTAYLVYDLIGAHVRHWDGLRRIAGIDVTTRPWVQQVGRFAMMFLPPGAPVGVFGDGAERRLDEAIPRMAHAYARRVPTPLSAWYASQWQGQDEARLELLTAPLPPRQPAPAKLPDSAVFPSVGWAAMHSSLADRKRLSLYFKSSPYGSLSHGHADQNAFVVHAGGVPLLAKAGVYDGYFTPHRMQWYRQTKAHNAITVDGGQGQALGMSLTGNEAAAGRVSGFGHHKGQPFVVGNAAAAWAGQMSLAWRSVQQVDAQRFLVIDWMEATQPRRWDWWLHGPAAFSEPVPGSVEVADGGQRVCVQLASEQAGRFDLTQGFPPDASPAAPAVNGWHARFGSAGPSGAWRSAALISRGACPPDAARLAVQWTASAIQVNLAGHGRLQLQRDGALQFEPAP